jgi:hypothetical protein
VPDVQPVRAVAHVRHAHELLCECGEWRADVAYLCVEFRLTDRSLHPPCQARNNWRCERCSAVVHKTARAAHVHCVVCSALCVGGEAGAAKHMNLLHEPWPCDLGCGESVAPRYWQEHASAECPCRKVACVYCSLQVTASTRHEHEAMCGGRSVPCEVCSKLEARKRMARHLALAHGIGDVAAFAGACEQDAILPSFLLPLHFELFTSSPALPLLLLRRHADPSITVRHAAAHRLTAR